MFKFLKSLNQGGKPTGAGKPSKAKPLPSSGVKTPARPPDPLKPLSAPPAQDIKTPPAQFTKTRMTDNRPMNPEREKMIKEALDIHRKQQQVFADLDEEARHKLVLMAMLSLLKEARGDK